MKRWVYPSMTFDPRTLQSPRRTRTSTEPRCCSALFYALLTQNAIFSKRPKGLVVCLALSIATEWPNNPFTFLNPKDSRVIAHKAEYGK